MSSWECGPPLIGAPRQRRGRAASGSEIPQPPAGGAGMVLVAVDRERSPALSVAAELARRGAGRLTVLACVKETSALAWYDPAAWALLRKSPEESEGFVRRVLGEVPSDVPVTGWLRRRSALRALLEEARGGAYDALVIGAGSQRRLTRSWRSRMLLRDGWPGRLVIAPDS